jgi:hypothetical protein
MCVADSSFSRHITQMGLFVNHSLSKCPFRQQWSVFNFKSSHALLAEGLNMNTLACSNAHKESNCSCGLWLPSPWPILCQLPGPMNGHPDHKLSNWYAISLSTTSSWPGTHIGYILLCLPYCVRDCWQSQTCFQAIPWLFQALIAAS